MDLAQININIKKELETCLKAFDDTKKRLEFEGQTILAELNAVPIGGGAPIGLDTPLVDGEGYPRNDIDIYRARDLRRRFNEILTDRNDLMFKIEDGLKNLALLNVSDLDWYQFKVHQPNEICYLYAIHLNLNSSSFQNINNKEKEVAEKNARLAIKPKPKFDPISGKWVLSNWDGTIAGIENGHERSFDNIPIASSRLPEAAPPSSNSNAPFQTEEKSDLTNIDSPGNIPFAIIDFVSLESPASQSGLKEGDLIVKFGTADHTNDPNLKKITEIVPLASSSGTYIPISLLRRNRDGTALVSLTLNIYPRPWRGRGLIGCHISPYSL